MPTVTQASSSNGTHLTISRVNRLLRPLRNKCASLASYYTSCKEGRHGAWSHKNTYTSRSTIHPSSSRPHASAPLAILRPPDWLNSRIHLDKDCWETLELSRKIYAVHDCFKTIVQVAFGAGQEANYRIPSLTTMCAGIIGKHIQPEIDDDAKSKGGEHDLDDELTEVINSLYEAVPLHYRRWTIVSHALSIILLLCPHHPTLLTILLDTCLAAILVPESCTLLRKLLIVAFSPASPDSLPRICHLAHSTYLTDLRSKWVTCTARIHQGNPNYVPGHTDRAFSRILVQILADSNTPYVWTCKSVAKLARATQERDLEAFIHIAYGLSEVVGRNCTTSRKGRRSLKGKDVEKAVEGTGLSTLRHRLQKWTDAMLDELFAGTSSARPVGHPNETVDKYRSIIHFLKGVRSLSIHYSRETSAATEPDLTDSLVCLASCCLVTQTHSAVPSDILDICLLLRDASAPVTSTYNHLVTHIFHDTESVQFGDWSDNVLRGLRMHALALQSHSLLELEASLWACALRHLERSSDLPSCARGDKCSGAVESLRVRLIEEVDGAERRCFGAVSADTRRSSVSHAHPLGNLEQAGEWEWEEMVGSWVRKSPAVKKPKLDGGQAPRQTLRKKTMQPPWTRSRPTGSVPFAKMSRDPRIIQGSNIVTPASLTSGSCTPSSRSSSVRAGCKPSLTDESSMTSDTEKVGILASEFKENEDILSSPILPIEKAPRRMSDFASILTDALMNRIVLHHNQAPIPLPRDPYTPVQNRNAAIQDYDPTTILASDDALDMFAYAVSSSPSRF